MRKSQDFKAKLMLEYRDNGILFDQLLNMLVMALEIAGMDKTQSRAYQEKILDNL